MLLTFPGYAHHKIKSIPQKEIETVLLVIQLQAPGYFIQRVQSFNNGYFSYSKCIEKRKKLIQKWTKPNINIIHMECYIQ